MPGRCQKFSSRILRDVLASIVDYPINRIEQLLVWNRAAQQAASASVQEAA
jgi:hypothetical protein